ncbi:PREDICTED: EIN3-binding F-box protein 2 [Rhagoletis zephyria]|uniref:EIN3-binding F-box protein 2 n=1 Tax=Rhagoletis zephyria TaxID=28612 RepID=UPI0008115506|nr:PREDICTED: EIN3-binding F-box protein 2 [Rhagoletis zephyria]
MQYFYKLSTKDFDQYTALITQRFSVHKMGTIQNNDKEYSSSTLSYGELPMEIILHIFRYLSAADMQIAGRTCQRWREATFNTEFTKRVLVRFSKLCLSDMLTPAKDYAKSEMPFRNFCFEEISFGPVQQAMSHIGSTAKEIIFDNVDIGVKQFCEIMRLLPNITSLKITHCSQLFMSGSFLENEPGLSFANIHHLSLSDNQYISDAILMRLTEMLESIYSLDLSGCHIAYHNAIQRRFYPNEGDILPCESILTFKFIIRILALHHEHIRCLNFSNTLIGAPALSALCELERGELHLHRLGLAKCRQLNAISLNLLLTSQTNLLVLDLSDTICVNDSCLDVIVKSVSSLQELNIAGCVNISNEGASLLNKLKNLKHLNVSRCDGIQSDGLTNGVAATLNVTLLILHMSHIQVCEEAIKVLAKNLPELRVLNLGYCVNGVTDESVQSIIQNLRWLRELSLESCFRITDAALTGINITQLVRAPNLRNSLDGIQSYSNLENRDCLNKSNQLFKISLRSKAEEEIVRDANRKKAMFEAYELNLIEECSTDGYNLKHLKGLKSLNLSSCNKISDVSLKYGIQFLELRHLSLSNCQQISLIGVQQMVKDCPSIEILDLSDCESINDKAIQIITKALTRLRILHISGCSQLTDHSLDAILVNCKNLQTLSIHRCPRICTDIEERLAEMTTLRNIKVDNTTNMDNACLLRLKKRLEC